MSSRLSSYVARTVVVVIAMAFSGMALAQDKIETTGTPGSPGATTTIDGKQLPAPEPKFGGVTKNDALQSKPWWAPRIVPPKSAPNVLLIITDDAGFGVPGTFGGVIPTPTLSVDGKVVATNSMDKTLPMILQWDESFDVGSDTLTGVNDADYTPPFTLTARLNKLTLKVDRPQLTEADIKKLDSGQATAVDGSPMKHVQPGPH